MAENSKNVKEEKLISKAGKHLTFKINDEIYALEILKVQEIICMMKITTIPKTPPFIRGVINLRGKVIPVLELSIKFDFEKKEEDEKTCIIVVQVANFLESSIATMGIIVDEVSEVIDMTDDQIEPTPSFGSSIDTDFIMGMGKIDHKVITLLDIDKVLSLNELKKITEIK